MSNDDSSAETATEPETTAEAGPTKDEVARFLIDTIRENGATRTYQSALARKVNERFGGRWLEKTQQHNWSIDKAVLRAFQPLKDDHVVWDRSDQSWRVITDEQLADQVERDRIRADRQVKADAKRAARAAEQE